MPRNGKESGLICSVKFFSSDISHYRDRRSTLSACNPFAASAYKILADKTLVTSVFLWYSLRTLPERLLLYARKGVAVAKGVVNINIERCKACGFCVEFCRRRFWRFLPLQHERLSPSACRSAGEMQWLRSVRHVLPGFAIYAYRIKEPLEQKESLMHADPAGVLTGCTFWTGTLLAVKAHWPRELVSLPAIRSLPRRK